MTRRAALVVALLLSAGCARTSGTVEVPPEDLPFGVARRPTPSTTAARTTHVTVYFVRAQRLASARRRIQAGPLSAAALGRALLDGPDARERAAGLRTYLPVAVSLLGVVVREGVATVDLSAEFQKPAPKDAIALRVAQVAWTLTELPGVNEVAFSIDGEPISVSAVDGTSLERPVRRGDYARLAPIR